MVIKIRNSRQFCDRDLDACRQLRSFRLLQGQPIAPLQISALRFCSSFTACAPTLPVPPVTKLLGPRRNLWVSSRALGRISFLLPSSLAALSNNRSSDEWPKRLFDGPFSPIGRIGNTGAVGSTPNNGHSANRDQTEKNTGYEKETLLGCWQHR